MVATSENCMMLISKVGNLSERVFRCKTCLKEFSSFQALGGHRASHNKFINQSSLSLGLVVMNKKAKTTTLHLCTICGVKFPMGQALGGHMRKHRNEKGFGGALVTRTLLPEEIEFKSLKKSSSGKRVMSLDLGFDSVESFINLKLELGRTIY